MARRGLASPSPARLAAALALLDAEKGRHLDSALTAHLDSLSLRPEDRGLAWHLAFGVMRRRGELDAALASAARRDPARLDPPVRIALRLGLFELRHTRTPAHAAVDQAVRLAKALKVGHAAGLVNAALRAAPTAQPGEPWVNLPPWLAQRRLARHGEATLAAWCAREDNPAPLALVARTDPAALEQAFAAAGLPLRPGRAGGQPVPGAFWLDGQHRVESLPGYAEGAFWVMDPAAAAVADLLGAQPGDRVLDACCAPGGKTLRLASQGAKVSAVDLAARLGPVRENLARLGLEAEVTALDWLENSPDWPSFDAVLLDAPCSGLGTLRRHPEIRWSRQPTDLPAHALQQQRLLTRLAPRVRPGGVLVYAVCSPEPEEGVGVIKAFLAQHPDFVVEQILSFDPPSEDEDAHWAARLRHRPAP